MRVLALEVWRREDEWRTYAVLLSSDGTYRPVAWHGRDHATNLLTLTGADKNVISIPPRSRLAMDCTGWEGQTFSLAGAAKKMLRRRIHGDIGGVEGWLPCYHGDLNVRLKGRATVTKFGTAAEQDFDDKPVKAEAVVPVADLYKDAKRLRALRKARKAKRVLEETNRKMKDSGMARVKAYHPHSAALWANVACVGVAEDGTIHDGVVVANNPAFATVETVIDACGRPVVWYLGNRAQRTDTRVGLSEE